jgi:hypothetical protein
MRAARVMSRQATPFGNARSLRRNLLMPNSGKINTPTAMYDARSRGASLVLAVVDGDVVMVIVVVVGPEPGTRVAGLKTTVAPGGRPVAERVTEEAKYPLRPASVSV